MSDTILKDNLKDYDVLVVNAHKFGFSGRNNPVDSQDHGLIGDYVYVTKKTEDIVHEAHINEDGNYVVGKVVASAVKTTGDDAGLIVSYVKNSSSAFNALYESQEGFVVSTKLPADSDSRSAIKFATSQFLFGKFILGHNLFQVTENDITKLVAEFHNAEEPETPGTPGESEKKVENEPTPAPKPEEPAEEPAK